MTAALDAIRARDADVPWTAVLGAPVTFREEYVWQALEDRHVLLAANAAERARLAELVGAARGWVELWNEHGDAFVPVSTTAMNLAMAQLGRAVRALADVAGGGDVVSPNDYRTDWQTMYETCVAAREADIAEASAQAAAAERARLAELVAGLPTRMLDDDGDGYGGVPFVDLWVLQALLDKAAPE